MNDDINMRYENLLNKNKDIFFITGGYLDPNGENIKIKVLKRREFFSLMSIIIFSCFISTIISYSISHFIFYSLNLNIKDFPVLGLGISTFLSVCMMAAIFLKKSKLLNATFNKIILKHKTEIKEQIKRQLIV